MMSFFLRILLDAQANGSRGTGEGDEWNLFFFFLAAGGIKRFTHRTTRVGRRTLTFDSLVAGGVLVNTERRYTHTGEP